MRKKKERIRGKEINFENSWVVDKLIDRESFLSRIFKLVPDNSIWAIEGIKDKHLIDFLNNFTVSDAQSVALGTDWPKQKTFKIRIDNESRDKLIEKIPEMNLDWEIIHQHIYDGDTFYLTSYDNLSDSCTWISKDFSKEDFQDLIDDEKVSIIDYNEYFANETKIKPIDKVLYFVKLFGWILFVWLTVKLIGFLVWAIKGFDDDFPILFSDELKHLIKTQDIIEGILCLILLLGLYVSLRKSKMFFILLISIIFFTKIWIVNWIYLLIY